MSKKITFSGILWVIIILVILGNLYLLLQIREKSNDNIPLKALKIEKPTIVLVMNENECTDCIQNLLFMNKIYHELKPEGKIDIVGVVLSQNKRDSKRITKVFEFPVSVWDNFSIMRRLNLNRTPVIIGITPEHRIVFCDLIPFETGVEEEFIQKGVLDRLYYSYSFSSN